MKCFHSTSFQLPLPPNHRFPMQKYTALYERVLEHFGEDGISIAPPVSDSVLALAHDEDYLKGVIAGILPKNELRRIGFPWSPQMVERSRRSTGATLAGAQHALIHGRGANLAGGTHHARRKRGGGYCVFNDTAVTLKSLERDGLIRRGLVIDLDVHQGDGTADILRADPAHFTFSMHAEKNYPFDKVESDLDLPLPDHTSDEHYLDLLSTHLPLIFDQGQPDLVVYLAGADPFYKDQLGRLKLTKAGLAARDALVFEACDRRGVPVVVTMGGGYAPQIEEIVALHFNTILIASGQSPELYAEPKA